MGAYCKDATDSAKKSAQDEDCKVNNEVGVKCHIIAAARTWCPDFVKKADAWNEKWKDVFGKALPILKRTIVQPKRVFSAAQKKKTMKVDYKAAKCSEGQVMKWDKDNEKIICATECAGDEVAIQKKVVMRAPPKTSAAKAIAKRGGKRLLKGAGGKGGDGKEGGDKGGFGGDGKEGGDKGGFGGDGKEGDEGPKGGKAAQDERENKMKEMSKGKISAKDKAAAIKKMQKPVVVCVPKPDNAKSKII